MRLPATEGRIEAVVGLAAALSVGVGWSIDLWSAGAPWVARVYQNVLVEGSDLGLALLVAYALLGGGSSAEARLARTTKIVSIAGGVLLVFLALSVFGAIAPLVSIATTAHVALGLLAYLAVARRPRLARWLLIGFGCLIVLEVPLVALQEVTQSQFPLVQLFGFRGDPELATTAGAAVVFGAHGARWQRAMGTFVHPNVLAGFLALSLMLALPLRARLDQRWHSVWLIAWSVAWLELVFTFSRAGLVAALVGSGIWFGCRRTRAGRAFTRVQFLIPPAIAFVGATFVAGPFLLPRIVPSASVLNSTSIAGRLLLGSVAVALIWAHPLFGVGAGNFSLAELLPPFDAVAVDPVHVVPLLVAAEAGIPAGFAWLALVVGGSLTRSWHRHFDATSSAELALPTAVLTLAMLDHYLWTLGQGRAAFWLGLGIWAAQTQDGETTGSDQLDGHEETTSGLSERGLGVAPNSRVPGRGSGWLRSRNHREEIR